MKINSIDLRVASPIGEFPHTLAQDAMWAALSRARAA
jgi:hypothetical protein